MSEFENLLERPKTKRVQKFGSKGVAPHIEAGELSLEQRQVDPYNFTYDLPKSYRRSIFDEQPVVARREVSVEGGTWLPTAEDSLDAKTLKKIGTYSVEKVVSRAAFLGGVTLDHGVRINFIVYEGGSVLVQREALGEQLWAESFARQKKEGISIFENVMNVPMAMGDQPVVEHGIPDGKTEPVTNFKFREAIRGVQPGVDYDAFNAYDPAKVDPLKINTSLMKDLPGFGPIRSVRPNSGAGRYYVEPTRYEDVLEGVDLRTKLDTDFPKNLPKTRQQEALDRAAEAWENRPQSLSGDVPNQEMRTFMQSEPLNLFPRTDFNRVITNFLEHDEKNLKKSRPEDYTDRQRKLEEKYRIQREDFKLGPDFQIPRIDQGLTFEELLKRMVDKDGTIIDGVPFTDVTKKKDDKVDPQT